MSERLFSFTGGEQGVWQVSAMHCLSGPELPSVAWLSVVPGAAAPCDAPGVGWTLRGMASNDRYLMRQEKDQLLAIQPALGRPPSTCAALIPIRKTAAWWALTQQERRAIFEEQSHHTRTGLRYLPAIARKLHHCRDLSEREPFDFLTWFEYAPADEPAFNHLLAALRASKEWRYVDREIDIRLVKRR